MIYDLFPWLDDVYRYGLLVLIGVAVIVGGLGVGWVVRFWRTGR